MPNKAYLPQQVSTKLRPPLPQRLRPPFLPPTVRTRLRTKQPRNKRRFSFPTQKLTRTFQHLQGHIKGDRLALLEPPVQGTRKGNFSQAPMERPGAASVPKNRLRPSGTCRRRKYHRRTPSVKEVPRPRGAGRRHTRHTGTNPRHVDNTSKSIPLNGPRGGATRGRTRGKTNSTNNRFTKPYTKHLEGFRAREPSSLTRANRRRVGPKRVLGQKVAFHSPTFPGKGDSGNGKYLTRCPRTS